MTEQFVTVPVVRLRRLAERLRDTSRLRISRTGAGHEIEAMLTASNPDSACPGVGEEVRALRSSLTELLSACRFADAAGELAEAIDGGLLDAAEAALELQYPIIWTEEQVAALRVRQAEAMAHPYTCGNRSTDAGALALHQAQAEEDGDDESGLLIPTRRGWICPACDYRQFWSHETGGPAALASPPSLQGGEDRVSVLEEAAKRLIAVFDQQRMTVAERIVCGISDAGLRTEGNAAIEALRTALSIQRKR